MAVKQVGGKIIRERLQFCLTPKGTSQKLPRLYSKSNRTLSSSPDSTLNQASIAIQQALTLSLKVSPPSPPSPFAGVMHLLKAIL
jgi:hypothetical protein